MPVPVNLTDLTVSEATNSPPDSEAVTSTTRPSDYMRALAAILRRLRARGADVASAATVDLGAINDGEYVHITGVTTITSFGTVSAGVQRRLLFADALVLTHNPTSLILPGNANITTAAGDVALMISEGAGNWRCVGYMRVSGLTSVTTNGSIASITINDAGASGANLLLNGNTAIPKKYIRSNGGNLEIVNSAYTAVIMSITDAGALTITGPASVANAIGGSHAIPIGQADGRYLGMTQGLNLSGFSGYGVNTVLTSADFGRPIFNNAASPLTHTLPAAAGNNGKTITVSSIGNYPTTLNSAGGNFYALGVSGAASVSIPPGSSLTVASDGGNWIQVNGTKSFIAGNPVDVTASRVAGTTYTNSSAYDKYVDVYTTNASQNQITLTVAGIVVDSSSWNAGSGSGVSTVKYPVPPGATYSITLLSGAIAMWTERG